MMITYFNIIPDELIFIIFKKFSYLEIINIEENIGIPFTNDNIFKLLYYYKYNNNNMLADAKPRYITWEYLCKINENYNYDVINNTKILSWLYENVPYIYNKIKHLLPCIVEEIYNDISSFINEIKPFDYRNLKDNLYYPGDLPVIDKGGDTCSTPKYDKLYYGSKTIKSHDIIKNNDILGIDKYNNRDKDTKRFIAYLKYGDESSYYFTSIITLNYNLMSYILNNNNFTIEAEVLINIGKCYLYRKEYDNLYKFFKNMDESILINMLSLNIDYKLPTPSAFDVCRSDFDYKGSYIDHVESFLSKNEYRGKDNKVPDKNSKDRCLITYCYTLIPDIKSLVRKNRKKVINKINNNK